MGHSINFKTKWNKTTLKTKNQCNDRTETCIIMIYKNNKRLMLVYYTSLNYINCAE